MVSRDSFQDQKLSHPRTFRLLASPRHLPCVSHERYLQCGNKTLCGCHPHSVAGKRNDKLHRFYPAVWAQISPQRHHSSQVEKFSGIRIEPNKGRKRSSREQNAWYLSSSKSFETIP